MSTTLRIREDLVEEIKRIYKINDESKAVEKALSDIVKEKGRDLLKSLAGKIEFDINARDIEMMREKEFEQT